ncbi:MAG: GNAT family N-acetyltransferase [Pseudomonadota bacterium]
MTFRSIGLASDALVMRDQSVFEEYPNRIVMRTPDEPDYWHGNLVIMREAGDPTEDIAWFARDFPDASHLTVVWDVPGLDPAPLASALPGVEVATFDVLSLLGPVSDAPAPAGIELRPVTDWDALLDLQLEAAKDEGYDLAAHKRYLRRRNTALRTQITADRGQWFGAFDGDLLVGTLGIFHDDSLARYQSVITRASHRRQGICAALLAHSGQWARNRAPHATLVIVAEAESNAGRLYRRAGFALTETLVDATRRGY